MTTRPRGSPILGIIPRSWSTIEKRTWLPKLKHAFIWCIYDLCLNYSSTLNSQLTEVLSLNNCEPPFSRAVVWPVWAWAWPRPVLGLRGVICVCCHRDCHRSPWAVGACPSVCSSITCVSLAKHIWSARADAGAVVQRHS